MVQSSHEHNVCEGKGRPKEREGPKVTRKEERKGGREGGFFLSLYTLILPMNDVAIYWRRVTKAEDKIDIRSTLL